MTLGTEPRPGEADAGSRTADHRRADRTAGALAGAAFVAALDQLLIDLVRDRTGLAGLALIAVDDVSGIDARLGPEMTDRVLEAIGQRIAGRMRGGDVLGRLADDVFAVLLRDCPEPALQVAAERFRDTVDEAPVPLGDTHLAVTVSIGALLLPRHARDGATALQRAAEALDVARMDTEGRIRLHEPSLRDDRRHG